MRTILTMAVSGCLAIALAAAQSRSAADQFQEALRLEEVKGDLKGAIEQYRKLAQGGDRAIAARALVQMAGCYEKLGHGDARRTYELVVRDFKDQAESAARARARLAALESPAAVRTTAVQRLMWDDVSREGDIGPPSADGRYLSFTETETGDLAVRDLREDTTRRLTNTGGWVTSGSYADSSVISPDGRQVAYVWYDAETEQTRCCRYDLRVLPVNAGQGGTPRIVRRGDDRYMQIFGWTPDGRGLLVARELQDSANQLALVSTADGSVRAIKSFGRGPRPGWASLSPDGRFVAYDVTQGVAADIFVAAVDGSRDTVVVQDPAVDVFPLWSPDGSRLLFLSERTGNASLWAVPVDDGKSAGPAELLRVDLGYVWLLGITRNGALYYVASRAINNVHVAELDAGLNAAAAPSLATDRFVNANRAPVWSPDGESLAYQSLSVSRLAISIRIRSLKTGQEREVPTRVQSSGPVRWFPDGRSLLVASSGRYYRVDIATGDAELLHQVAAPHSQSSRPDLSPDGRAMFFVDCNAPCGDAASQARLMRFDLDGRRETELKRTTATTQFGSIAVSPDGAQLAYWQLTDGSRRWTDATQTSSVYVMPASGGEARHVYSSTIWQHGGQSAEGLAWTPDHRSLVVLRPQSNLNKPYTQVLWRVPLDGGTPGHMGIVTNRIRFPRIHPDGRRIAFDSVMDPNPSELWVAENFLPKASEAAPRTIQAPPR